MAAMLLVNGRTSDRLLPRSAGDLATATGLGLVVIFFCEAATVGFSVYGPDLHPGAARGRAPARAAM